MKSIRDVILKIYISSLLLFVFTAVRSQDTFENYIPNSFYRFYEKIILTEMQKQKFISGLNQIRSHINIFPIRKIEVLEQKNSINYRVRLSDPKEFLFFFANPDEDIESVPFFRFRIKDNSIGIMNSSRKISYQEIIKITRGVGEYTSFVYFFEDEKYFYNRGMTFTHKDVDFYNKILGSSHLYWIINKDYGGYANYKKLYKTETEKVIGFKNNDASEARTDGTYTLTFNETDPTIIINLK